MLKLPLQQFLDTDQASQKDTQFTFEKDFDTTNSGEQKICLKSYIQMVPMMK